MGEFRENIVLVNLRNNLREEVVVQEDPDLKNTTYVEHDDLLEWARKVGCEGDVDKMWSGHLSSVFIGFEDDGRDEGVAIYRNSLGSDWVASDEKLAFMAERLIPAAEVIKKIGKNPNKIIRKGGRNGTGRKKGRSCQPADRKTRRGSR